MFEPSSQQEAYDMMYDAFEFSERMGEPVLLRVVTRLAHSRAGCGTESDEASKRNLFSKDPKQFILLPANARVPKSESD